MDIRNSGLIVGLYLLVALVVAGAAGLSWHLLRADGQVADLLQVDGLDQRPVANQGGTLNEGHLHQRQEAFAEAAQRIKQLEALLERKTELLNRRTDLLRQQAAEYDALRRETDRYLMLLVEQLTAPPADGAGAEAPATPEQEQQARATMQAELARLRRQLQDSEMLESALESELEQLRLDLQSAQDRLAEVELQNLLGDGQAPRRPLATEALVRVGEEAVAVLMVSLRDERPEIRLWAADVLAEMGPVARAAVPLLNTARRDTDQAVSQAASRALAAINAGEP